MEVVVVVVVVVNVFLPLEDEGGISPARASASIDRKKATPHVSEQYLPPPLVITARFDAEVESGSSDASSRSTTLVVCTARASLSQRGLRQSRFQSVVPAPCA